MSTLEKPKEKDRAGLHGVIPSREISRQTRHLPLPMAERRKPLYTRRAQARVYRNNRIQFADHATGRRHHALMRNECTDGMYFETEVHLSPGAIIDIRVIPTPHLGVWSCKAEYAAEVRWCRPIRFHRLTRYGVGVRLFRTIKQ